jgi:tripartite-type tricarboxylate transporter receptor subunit TctC
MDSTRALAGAVMALAVLFAFSSGAAATYPERLIRFVVSAPAGTAPDIVARLIAPKMSEQLGQTIIIDNKAGANGNIAAAEVSKSASDGYTVLVTAAGTLTANPYLYPKVAVTNLEPITQIATVDFIVATRPSLNVGTLAALLDLIRRQPGKINGATTANGSFPHLAAELMKQNASLDFTIVKHNGGTAAGASVAGEHTDFVIETLAVLGSLVEAKRLVPIASTGPARSPLSPDLPTVSESGIGGYSFTGWVALAAPKGTPPDVTSVLQQAAAKALEDTTIRERLISMQFLPTVSTPQEFGRIIAQEKAKLGTIIEHAKLAE